MKAVFLSGPYAERIADALESIAKDLEVIAHPVEKVVTCERCGQPFGQGNAHGPGFCIDRRREVVA